jgi:mycofactocin system creatininase family protein
MVPLGSLEQHGPHLPLETDTIIATAVAHELARRCGGYLAPAVSFGASGEHQAFPGVISIGTPVLREMLIETAHSLSLWAGRILFVNAHGGNAAAITAAINQLRAEGREVGRVSCSGPGDAHAGRTETSLLLHLAPSMVRLGRAEAGNLTPIQTLMPDLIAWGVRALSANGVLGDPAGASADEGRALFATMVEVAVHAL